MGTTSLVTWTSGDYDQRGNLTGWVTCLGGNPQGCPGLGAGGNLGYDLNEDLISVAGDAGGPTYSGQANLISYGYDTAGRLNSIATDVSLDLSGNSLTSTAFSGLTWFPGGELKTASLGIDPTSKVPAVSLVRAFDNRSRITGEVDESSAKQNLYSYSVGYDSVGNVTSYNDSVAGTWTVKNDALHRFSSSTGTYSGKASSFQATYDHFGNRNVEYFTYNGVQNQPSPYLNFTTGNNRASTYTYDNAGNLLSDGTNNYLYDAENRICGVDQLSSESLIGYVYSPDGTRFGKGTITKTFSCDFTKNGMLTTNGLALTTGYNVAPNGDLLEETDGNFNLRHFNVFLQGKQLGTFAGTTYSQANWAFSLNDWLGTKRQIVKSGAGTTSYFSGPFGDYQSQAGTGSDPSAQHFTGKERDIESGLDYFPARYYSSNLGRFMSADWAAKPQAVPYADLMTPQSLNLYGYVKNNPLSGTDPDGHWPCCLILPPTPQQVVNMARNFGVGLVKAGLDALNGIQSDHALPSSAQAPMLHPSNTMQAVTMMAAPMLVAPAMTITVSAMAPAVIETESVSVTTLFRAVDSTEAQSILDTGQFLPSPNGTEYKGFFNTAEDAGQFGAQQVKNGGPATSIVSGSAPTDLVSSSPVHQAAGEGPGVLIKNEDLPQVTPQQ